MLGKAKDVYVQVKKKNDFVFNVWVARPVAAVVVAAISGTRLTPNQFTLINLFFFVVAAALLPLLPTWQGGLIAIAVLEWSYVLDCVDGMLARYKKIASKEGHLFDFFTDEVKAQLLVGVLAVRLWRTGGLGLDGKAWPEGALGFLFAGIAGTFIVAAAISLTNFVRRPEVSGKEQTVEAHYETVKQEKAVSPVRRVAQLVTAILRFLNHYPSHIWIFALAGRFDVFFWMYLALNFLYLGRGWLGIILRFGRF
jgi:phosphatidylglycerophosphate synthase